MKPYILPLAAALCLGSASVQGQGIDVRVNGEPVRFSGVGARSVDGRVMVPLRGVLEQLGAYVDWDQASQTVMASRGNMHLRLPLGSRYAYVNGSRTRLDVPAMEIAGTTMVPLRFVSESLGADVRWDNATETVYIDTGVGGRAHVSNGDDFDRFPGGRDQGLAHRGPGGNWIPTVFSVDSNLLGETLSPGERMRVTMRATAGGKAYFRVRGYAGEMMMRETSPGLYVGTFRNNTGQNMTIERRDILAGVTVGDRASRETYVGNGIHQNGP